MQPLSLRLQKIVDMVTDCECVADVGCDHGYVAMSLIENEKARKAICTDINSGPIKKATENVKRAGLLDDISLRIADGLQGIKPDEADAIIIAGMGGMLMIDILDKGMDCVRNAKEIILSPQSDIDVFREYLTKVGITILEEAMLIDEGKYYTIIKCFYTGDIHILTKAQLKYGPVLIERKDTVLKEYLEFERTKLSDLSEMLAQKGVKDRLAEVFEELKLNEEVLKEYEMCADS